MQHRPCTDRNCSHGRSPFNTIFRRGCVAEHGKAHKLNKPKCMSGEAKLSHPHAKLPSQVPSIQYRTSAYLLPVIFLGVVYGAYKDNYSNQESYDHCKSSFTQT